MFKSGQRWYSEAEPELGLGIILEVEHKLLKIHFPLCTETRTYGKTSSPLKRYIVPKEEEIVLNDNSTHIVAQSQENEGIIFYLTTENQIIPEMDLTAKIDLQGPLNRIIASNYDSNDFFKLRYDSFLEYRHYQSFTHKGMLSPKIRLIPHQIYVANKVLDLESPKAMLCDEVGLGKTIEASLILNSLIQRELVEKCLIIVPDSLVNQWFVELYKKFNLSFKTVTLENIDEIELNESQRIIIGHQLFKEAQDFIYDVQEQKWDMLIVDESHQIDIKKTDSLKVQTLKKINEKTYSTLFLSATPEVLGTENLYSQLNLLDPAKYKDYSEFQKQINVSKELSRIINNLKENKVNSDELAKYIPQQELNSLTEPDEIIQLLVDRFGTGRTYFRNSRQNLEQYSRLFNDRILHPTRIEISGKINDKIVIQNKAKTLIRLINENPDEKILIICHSKDVVLRLQKIILEEMNIKIAIFHSGQSLMERDRQAAYFSDEEGANILISTEVGSEGRNFEFASHLVLFDLPKVPDQLEQRIGRLDRIGQKNDINIHVPYISNSFEETMFTWYNDVLSSFTTSPKGASHFYNQHKNELITLLESQFNIDQLQSFIESKSKEYKNYSQELEKGRDLIVESHSYNDEKAKEYCKEISNFEEKTTPYDYLDKICHHIGLDLEELNDYSFFIKPSDNMLIPSFPGLPSEGFSFSFDRNYAQTNDQIHLLSWEHPLIKGALDLLINSQLGNTSFMQQQGLPRSIFIEIILNIQCSDRYKHLSSVFLPFTPLRVLLDIQGDDKTKDLPKKHIDSKQVETNNADEVLAILKSVPNEHMAKLTKKSQQLANKRAQKYIEKAKLEAQNKHKHELSRINSLKLEPELANELIRVEKEKNNQIITSICEAKLSLDSIRVILPKD